MMKNLLWLILLLGSITTSSTYAGGMEGGGGVGVLCYGKLEVLDEHEARISGISAREIPENENAAIDLVSHMAGVNTFDPSYSSIDDYINIIKESIIGPIFRGEPFLSVDWMGNEINTEIEFVDHLNVSPDIGQYKIDPKCKLIQIAYYEDGKFPKLKIVRHLWDRLSFKSKSYLVVHEYLYASQRFYNILSDIAFKSSSSSAWTRGYVGKYFSKEGVKSLYDGLANKSVKRCSSFNDAGPVSTDFYMFEEKGNVKIVYNLVNGLNDFYQLTSLVTNASLNSVYKMGASMTINFVDANVNSPLIYRLSFVSDEEAKGQLFYSELGIFLPVGKPQRLYCYDFQF